MTRRKRLLQSLALDIQDHIETETQDNIDRGMTPEDARCAALRKFGNITRIKEDTRAVWNPVWLEQLFQDVRYGTRMLRRNPVFTTVVILTLALGIGMNTAMFSIVNAVLLHPLAYRDGNRLIWIAKYDRYYESEHDVWVSHSDYSTFKDQAHSFENMAAYGDQDLALVYGNDSAAERIASITGDFWNITGARPFLGSLFKQGEPNTIVLSWPLFERRFGSDPRVIGKSLIINGHPFTITGVLPKNFQFLLPQQWIPGDERRDIDAYIPIPNPVLTLPVTNWKAWDETKQKFGPVPNAVCVIGKLKPNISLENAKAELRTIYDRIVPVGLYPTLFHTHEGLRIRSLKTKLVGNVRPAILVLFVAVGFVLLIASANIANLLLARASTRQREIAIRAAMGAGRTRVTRQFLAENILLAVLGGFAGLALAKCALILVIHFGSESIPRLSDAKMDGWVLLFTLLASLSTGIFFGLAPAISLWRTNVHDVLKDEGRTSSVGAGRLRFRGLLVAFELGVAMVLLTGAGLMLKSFWRMTSYPPGFEPEKILVTRISLSEMHYQAWAQEDAYLHALFGRLQRAPGVQAFGVDCGTLHQPVRLEGASPTSPGDQQGAAIRAVSPGYLRALGVPLVAGHWPTESEALDVVLVNQSLARKIASRDSIVGQRIHGSFLNATVAGVVADFKDNQLDAEPIPQVYMAYQMAPAVASVGVIVRMSGNLKPAVAAIPKLISSIDPNVPVLQLRTLEQELSDSVAPRRFNLFLLAAFAGTALLLALIGIYGVMAYLVTQRTPEIGIRMALGAQRGEIVQMIVRQGMKITLAGITVGLIAAFALTRVMASMLYGVRADDPATFATGAATLALTALLACCVPALKAALVDPMIALRHD